MEISSHQASHDFIEDLWAAVEGGHIVDDMTPLSLALAISDFPYFLSAQDPSVPSKTASPYTSPCETLRKVRYSKCPPPTPTPVRLHT